MLPSLPPAISSYCVRLSSNNELVGSGFIVDFGQPDEMFILTARHCLFDTKMEKLIEPISVDFYDLKRQEFISSVPVSKRLYFDPSSNDSYDIAILPISVPKETLGLPPVKLIDAVIDNQIYQFQGFPKGRQGLKPVFIEAKVSFTAEYEIELSSLSSRPESNETSAQDNIMGISGSGLLSKQTDELVLSGIVTHYNQDFNVYTAFNFSRINELLQNQGYSPLLISVAQSVVLETADPSFIYQNKDLLNQAEELWRNLQPEQALLLIESVERNITESTLSSQHRDPLLAKINFLTAFVQIDLKPSYLPYTKFIEAYNLHKTHLKYQQRAVSALYYQNEPLAAHQLVAEILRTDPYDPYALLIRHQLRSEIAVPDHVKKLPAFKLGLIVAWSHQGKPITFSDLEALFNEELENKLLPVDIDRLNIYYWNYVARAALYNSLERYGNEGMGLQKPFSLKEDSLFIYAVSLLEKIVKRISGTILENHTIFQLAKYDYCCGRYYLSDNTQEDKQLAIELYELYIGNPRQLIARSSNERQAVSQIIPERLTELLVILLQQQEPQLVIDAVALSSDVNSPDISFLVGQAYRQLERQSEMLQAFRQYLNQLIEIDQRDAANMLSALNEFRIASLINNDLIDNVIAGKTFSDDYLKSLLIAYCYTYNLSLHDQAKAEADLVRRHWTTMHISLRESLAQIYSILQDWTIAKSLWLDLIDDSKRESSALRAYLISWYYERQSVKELAGELARWRLNFEPDQTLIQLEINLYQSLNNYAGIAEVTDYALTHFPDVTDFWAMRIWSLYRLSNTDLLLPLLDDRLLDITVSPSDKWNLARIYLLCGQNDIGKEAFYQVLNQNNTDPAFKTAYLGLTTQFEKAYNTPSPEVVEIGSVVRYQTDTDRKVVEITAQSVEKIPIAKAFLGRGKNEPIEIEFPTLRRTKTYWIDQIFDKYNGLAVLITEEVSSNPDLNPYLHSFEIKPAISGDQLLEQFREVMGPPLFESQQLSKQAKQLFADRKIGFHELAQSAFNGNPVGAWEFVTSDSGSGWPVYPLIFIKTYHSPITVVEETKFVLDFSALLLLSQLAPSESVRYQDKLFVVSQFTIDYIDTELEKARYQSDTPMSIGYEGDQIKAFPHAPDRRQRKIIFWTTLQAWVRQNCQPDYSWERLSVDWQDKDGEDQLFSNKSQYESSIMDNFC